MIQSTISSGDQLIRRKGYDGGRDSSLVTVRSRLIKYEVVCVRCIVPKAVVEH
jgi:hypothetical protein